MKNSYIITDLTVSDLKVPQVSTALNRSDFGGAVMVRWGINRDNFKVAPGLYAVGFPDAESDVFVTSNYKLSFDHLRKNLSGINGWILVLDTKGINVWCAAGKGTFGTKELVNRIRTVSLEKIVTHRRIILPQLGATGVAAHTVREETGFNVHYGPVRASDIRKFIDKGYRADNDMRKVKFGFNDRVKLIPNDVIQGKLYLLGAMAVLFLISGLGKNGLSYSDFSGEGGPSILMAVLAYFAGIVLTPAFLPYIPGRHFSLKGFFSGMVVFIVYLLVSSGQNILVTVSWFFITGAISSFVAMNFTGSSTFTSLSGVKKEMKIFIPLQISFAAIGVILQVIGNFI